MDKNVEEELAETELRVSQREAALRSKDSLQALTTSPGWLIIVAFMDEQVKYRTDKVMLEPSTGLKSQLEESFMKGECCAYRTLKMIVETGIESATAVAESLEDDDRDTSSSDGSDV